MKSRNVLILIILLILLCGCEEKEDYSSFEHYDVDVYNDRYTYSYVGEDNIQRVYVIADISEEHSEAITNGLFYKIKEDDYILLDKFDSCGYQAAYKDKTKTYFFNDELYITRCSGSVAFKYELSGANTKKIDISEKLTDKYLLNSIFNVDSEYIYYNASETLSSSDIEIKCSKNSFSCELID